MALREFSSTALGRASEHERQLGRRGRPHTRRPTRPRSSCQAVENVARHRGTASEMVKPTSVANWMYPAGRAVRCCSIASASAIPTPCRCAACRSSQLAAAQPAHSSARSTTRSTATSYPSTGSFPTPSAVIGTGLPSARPIVTKNRQGTSHCGCPCSSRRSTSKSIRQPHTAGRSPKSRAQARHERDSRVVSTVQHVLDREKLTRRSVDQIRPLPSLRLHQSDQSSPVLGSRVRHMHIR